MKTIILVAVFASNSHVIWTRKASRVKSALFAQKLVQ
jgi:hypothetical protein